MSVHVVLNHTSGQFFAIIPYLFVWFHIRFEVLYNDRLSTFRLSASHAKQLVL